MKKTPFLLKSAAAGMLIFAACSDDSGNSASISSTGACLLNPTENGLEILCNKESYGLIKSSEDGIYGASCTAEALKDDSGYKLICGGDSVGVVYNGDHGRNGVNGTNGLPGAPGETGAPGANGTSCSAVQVDDGFDLFCDEEKVGTISSGLPCSSKETEDGVSISCPDGTSAVVKNGVNGTNGLNGTSCTTSSLKSSDLNGVYSTITCGTTTVKIYDGAKGEQGEQGDPGENCSVSKNTTTGVTTITCGEDVALVNDGAAGAKGDAGYSCSATSGTGYSTIKCQNGVVAETGDPTYTETVILAAGYAYCKVSDVDHVYNTLTQSCNSTTGDVTNFNCGSTMIDEDVQFCENGKAYNKNDYLTAATTYPKATYGKCGDDESNPENVVVGEYYLKASQYCVGTVATEKYQECGGLLYNATTHFCEGTSLYALCGGLTYNPTNEFCAADAKYGKCNGATYDPATQECDTTDPENPSVKDKE